MSVISRFILGRVGLVILILLSAASAPLKAAEFAIWLGANGNWSDPTRWSTNPLFPDNGNGGFSYDVLISSGTVTLDQPIAIDGLNGTGGNLRGAIDAEPRRGECMERSYGQAFFWRANVEQQRDDHLVRR